MSKSYIIEGKFSPVYKTDDFEIEIELLKSNLRIRGLSKSLLIHKKIELSKEHAIYILEGPNSCYIGQTTDVQTRINNHKDNNKSDFQRCFILSKKDFDLRGYLDYIESYAIKEMEEQGYLLDNSKKPDPNNDILSIYKKEMANEWIHEFLSFLPILGFKKSPRPSINLPKLTQPKVIKQKDVINLKFNGNLINGKYNVEILINLFKLIGINNIIQNCSSIFNSSFHLTNIKIDKKTKCACHELKENNNTYYLYINISKNNLCKKIMKIKDILQLNIEIN